MSEKEVKVKDAEPVITCGYCGDTKKDGVVLGVIAIVNWPLAPQLHKRQIPVDVPLCTECLTDITDRLHTLAHKNKIIVPTRKIN